MKKTLVYMIVQDTDAILLPPLGDNSDCDFVVFTDCCQLQSKYWEIRFDENICNHKEEMIRDPKLFIPNYEKYIFVKNKQVICGSLSTDENCLWTVPSIESLLPEGTPLIEPTFEEVLPNPTYTDGPYNGYPLQLSICLPVSNRKDTLYKCLEGIKPLLTHLKSELIVVDSSNDGSREIAESYGAKIIPYTWRNDFAHARNTAVREAKGAWIFSLDDDEWFESVDEIIKFFKGTQWKTCDLASYTVRNYTDAEGKTYNDFYAERMARNHPSLHYKNAIHECLDLSFLGRQPGSKYFSDYAHHFGYVYKTDLEREKKLFRNIAGLYTALKATPLDLRLWLQLCTEITSLKKYETATSFCFQLIALCKLQRENPTANAAHWNRVALIFLYTAAQIIGGDDLFQRIFSITDFKDLNCFQHGCINYFLISHAFNRKQYQEICKYAEEYYVLRKEYFAAPSKALLSLSVQTNLVEPTRRYNTILVLHAFSLMELGEPERCANLLGKINFDEVDENDQSLLAPVFYKLPEKFFKKIFPKVNENIIELLYNHTKRLYNNSLQPSSGIVSVETGNFIDLSAKVSAANCFKDNLYVRLMQLYGNPADLSTYDWFCEDQSRMEKALGDLCLPALLNGYDLHNFTAKLKLEGIQQMIRSLSAASKDEFMQLYESYLQEHMEKKDFENLSLEEVYLFTGFLEAHLLNMSQEAFKELESQYLEFFTCYITLLHKWTTINYNIQLLEGDCFSLLPATSRGAVHMVKAFDASAQKEVRIAAVKAAVAECPLFDKGAKLLLTSIVSETSPSKDKVKSTIASESQAPKTEFELLGEQLKGTAKQLLDSGQFSEAQNILLQLSQFLPADEEVKELLSRCTASNLVH